MLPQMPSEAGVPSRTIYINPNFQNKSETAPQTHINPNFLIPRTTSTTIHLNPQFLQKKLLEQELMAQQLRRQQLQQHDLTTTAAPKVVVVKETPEIPEMSTNHSTTTPTCKLITKSRMRIVRQTVVNKMSPTSTASASSAAPTSHMIKVGPRKLMRSTLVRPTATPAALVQQSPLRKVTPAATSTGKYKIDRRRTRSFTVSNASPLAKVKRRVGFVARYALRRTTDSISKRRLNSNNISTTTTTLNTAFKLSAVPSNKNLQMLNINGVLYKSTRNKLQRNDVQGTQSLLAQRKSTKVGTKTSGRTLIVRGTRFVLDKEGFKLTRDPTYSEQTPNNFSRIDIGGLTYVATKQKNVFVRTGNHLARSHVNNAKQKSLQVLSRSLVKSNVPCAIFQHVGKCAAFERGKCRKVHDRRQVAICPRYLRGDCSNSNCLLSHNVSLSKMPVCKFFLQGVCVRSDCPYLHKKVSKNTEICSDFIRGFCKLAEQCDKRHEFLCPDYERNGKCQKRNCLYCKRNRQVHREPKKLPREESAAVAIEANPKPEEDGPSKARYFIGERPEKECIPKTNEAIEQSDSSDNDCDTPSSSANTNASRPKLGTLPAYIPLS